MAKEGFCEKETLQETPEGREGTSHAELQGRDTGREDSKDTGRAGGLFPGCSHTARRAAWPQQRELGEGEG